MCLDNKEKVREKENRRKLKVGRHSQSPLDFL